MKKIVLVCLFIVSFMMTIDAQTNTTFEKETIAFIKLTGAGSAFENAIGQIGAAVSVENKDAYTKAAEATLVGLYAKMAGLYMDVFTREEIKELVVFYHTDLGRKLAIEQLGLAQRAMGFGQEWGMEVSAIASKY